MDHHRIDRYFTILRYKGRYHHMKILILPISILCLLASCNMPECANKNMVFDKYPPEAREYKAELIKQIQAADKSDLRFWINKYLKTDSTEYMLVDIQATNLCAKGIFDISSAKSLEQYKSVGGVSYSGAELSGLKYRIDSTNGTYHFIFDDVARIID